MKSKLGKNTIISSIILIILIIFKLFQIHIPIPSLIIGFFSVITFVLAIIDLLKNKNKSLWLLIPILWGLIVILWMIAEIVYPH